MYKSAITGAALLLGATLAAPAQQSAEPVTFDILGARGNIVGSVAIRTGPHGSVARVEINTETLEEGWHGMHFHDVGNCSDEPEFKASGSHINPGGTEHGFLNPDGFHPSDLANIYAGPDGGAHAELFVPGVMMEGGEVNLLDEDGSALVIHEAEDNHVSQPIGNAGERVACAVIK